MFRRVNRFFFFAAGLILFTGFVLQFVLPKHDVNAHFEVRGKYNPELTKFQTTDQIIAHVDSMAEHLQISSKSAAHVKLIDNFLQQRFYHGSARYAFHEHFIAYLGGKYVWSDLSLISKPNDLLKTNLTLCNQMAMVFAEILTHYEIPYRQVNLKHHLALEVFYDDDWHYHDPDYEINFDGAAPSATAFFKDSLWVARVYNAGPGAKYNDNYLQILATRTPEILEENAPIAGRLRLFHTLTWWLAQIGWAVCFLMWFLLKRNN